MLPSRRLKLATAWLGAVLVSGCSSAIGVSLEANAGLARTRIDDGNDPSNNRHELAVTAGVSLNLELDYLRDASFGAGVGYQAFSSPEAGTLSAFPFRVWYGGAIDDRGWKLRPRAALGLSAGGDAEAYLDAYLAAGASYHLAPGHALHVLFGPHAVHAENQMGTSFRGWGGTLRVRFFRMLQNTCDPVTRADVARVLGSGKGC